MIFCLLEENCCVYDRHNNVGGITRMSVICQGCRSRSESEINLLRYDYVDLSQHIVPADGRNNEAHIFRPKPESQPPIDVNAYALREEITALLVDCEAAVRKLAGDGLRSVRVREGFALDQAVRYLESRVDTLAVVDTVRYDSAAEPVSGLDALLLIGTLHRRARRAVGLLDPVVGLPGACPRCDVRALRRRDDGTQRVWCERCRTSMTITDYYAAMRMQFAPVTPDQATRST